MSDQIRDWEVKEDDMKVKTTVVQEVISVTRKEINALKQRRVAKEGVLEKFENRIKDMEARLKEVDARRKMNENDTRLDQLAKEKAKKIRNEIKSMLENQTKKSAEILNMLLKTDTQQRQLHSVVDREIRIQQRMRTLKDELMFLISRQDEVKLSVRKKIESIKHKHSRIFELEPQIKDSVKRNKDFAAKVAELAEKVKKGENEVRVVQTECLKMVGEMEKRSVECGQKQKRSVQGPPMIEALKPYTAPKKPIECYKVKNPDVIKAFERFTELYGGYNKVM